MDITANPRCDALAHPEPLSTTLAAIILVGVLISYLPQHYKIISNHTSEGLSPWWVLLGGLSAIAALGNILTLPGSRADMACCKSISGGACAAALLGVMQIGLQWACFMFIVMLFLTFFPVLPESDLASSTASLTNSPPPKRRDAVIVGGMTMLTLLLVGIISVALVYAWPRHTQNWANFLGTIAGVMAAVQYLPQIWHTWRLGDVKSLSVITMLIQVPGAFLFAFSLWQRVGWEGWSTWLVFIITGCLQSALLAMAISYHFQGKRKSHYIDYTDEEASFPGVDDVDGARTAVRHSRNSAIGSRVSNRGIRTLSGPDAEVNERSALLRNGDGSVKIRPARAVPRGTSNRQLSMLYAATPPDQDSDSSDVELRKGSRR
ncbi:hypothetical protein Tdes44962_MAKER06351 [Teratosphaeria destructans]|uniref:PQ loop repeat protein n=1 Tax=Teratosphaeria destructans TaxID=418781 RepID=A0A9W7VXI5_9PEZI|nr:hypothetical protein Tdes44962_MAKER06351 [Teratosphaeria destructans]